VGVILVSGNAVAMPWVNKVSGIMQLWYLGSEAGNAIADVISGDVNPSGKLPFTFPVKLEDNGAHSFGYLSYPGDTIDQYYKEEILVGYRWHDTKEIKPLFAFGHGLSYTQFTINNLKISATELNAGGVLKVNCKVTNTGAIDGAEVVQVYIGKNESKVERATKELKGFKKVKVGANASEEVSVSINIDDLAFWNEEMAGWELEKGEYFVAIGNASDNITKQLVFSVN
jgi:beta-glucosidase